MKRIKKILFILFALICILFLGYKLFFYWNYVWFKEERQEKIWNERVNNKNKHRKIENKIYTEQDKEK